MTKNVKVDPLISSVKEANAPGLPPRNDGWDGAFGGGGRFRICAEIRNNGKDGFLRGRCLYAHWKKWKVGIRFPRVTGRTGINYQWNLFQSQVLEKDRDDPDQHREAGRKQKLSRDQNQSKLNIDKQFMILTWDQGGQHQSKRDLPRIARALEFSHKCR